MNIEKLKQKILDLAIRGKLVPQDPNDEPASVLIEKIRQEKARLVKEGKIKASKDESFIFKGSDNCYYEKIGNLVNPISTSLKEIKSREILKEGLYPVISQSQKEIDGFCNDKDKLIQDLPIILFGDHTKVVKFIDKPFIPGADGTKLYTSKCFPKYLYYLVLYASKMIDDKGYARHNALLKEFKVPFYPDTNTQIIIALTLDDIFQIIETIELNRFDINELVSLSKQKILDNIFGENSSYKSYYTEKKLFEVANIVFGQSPSGDEISDVSKSNSIKFHQGKLYFGEKYLLKSPKNSTNSPKTTNGNSVVMSVRAPVGDVNICNRIICIGRGLCSIEPKENISSEYLYYYFLTKKKSLIEIASGSTFSAIKSNDVKNINILLCDETIQKEIVEDLTNAFELIEMIVS